MNKSERETDLTPTKGRTRIQSVARASRILMSIAQSIEGFTASEIAAKFDLSPPTAYHLLATLADEGLIAKNASRRYLLGPSATLIANAVSLQDVLPLSYLELSREIAARTSETVYISAWRGAQIRVLETIEGSHVLRVAGSAAGFTKLTHARARVKILLAFASEDVQDRVISTMTFERVTPNTITSEERYRRELRRIVEDGLAYDREEFFPGVICISAPIREGDLVVAALTVSMPAFRYDAAHIDVEKILREVVVKAARRAVTPDAV